MRGTLKATLLVMPSLIAWAGAAFADPPAHAPAHGWRKKHDPYYVGYTGVSWERDYEVSSGRCNREEIATVVGAVAGGVIANRVGEEHKGVATIIGIIAGGVIGNRIGKELDEADRGCLGHALEIAQPGQRVIWANEASGMKYELLPGAGSTRSGTPCREYTLVSIAGRDRSSQKGIACQSQPGVWQNAPGMTATAPTQQRR